jgi:L-iditol 2-dehydrogenase
VSRIFIHEVKIVPSYSTTEIETAAALRLIDKGLIKVERLITHKLPIGDAPRAIELASVGKDVLKVLVEG